MYLPSKTKKSQKEKVLNHLLTGADLTPIEALQKFGCYRLSSVIFRLKEEGYNIKTHKMINSENQRWYARYKLHDMGDVKYDAIDDYQVIKNL